MDFFGLSCDYVAVCLHWLLFHNAVEMVGPFKPHGEIKRNTGEGIRIIRMEQGCPAMGLIRGG